MCGDEKMLLLLMLAVHLVPCFGSVIHSLNGDDWTVSGSNITVPARVPGGIYTDLMRNGKIDDPYYRMNDVSLRWVAMTDWTYTKTFHVDDEFLDHTAVNLVAGGLDTIARVLINDVLVLEADNMFRRYVKDVTKVLKVGSNVIRVEFQSPVTYALNQAKQYPYEVPPDCPPPVQHGECHFNFIRKEACSFSWDWGPSFPSVGIWKNLTLEAYQASVLRYVTTDTEWMQDFWLLRVTVYLDLVSNTTVVPGTLQISIYDLGVSYNRQVTLAPGDTTQIVSLPLRTAESWWPNGLGFPQLYRMEVVFNNTLGDVDRRVVQVGFRTVELVEDAVGGEKPGYSFYFKINNVPVFIKGSNWIPADSFQERITPSYLEKLLSSAAEANMNMLRVWGGGVYESEEFYEIADRLGIMIWQDFMYACALYPSNEDFLANVGHEVIHQVRRLKRHPSIVIWSGNNENEGAIANNWFNVSSAQYSDDYRKLYIDTIRQRVMDEDKSRPFVPSSPSNGLDTIQEGWIAKDPQSNLYGDVHYYNYDGDTWDWRTFPMPRFASEFGIQSWCSMETLLPVSLPVDRNIDSDFVAHRQHHDQGNEEIRDEIAMHMPLPASRNGTQRFIDFIYLSQINQAVGIQTEVEFYRRSQALKADGLGLTMGALYWQLNDIWQGPTWASIEYGGKWKMLHYFAKNFYSRQLISPFMEDGLLKVYYIDDDAWTRTSDESVLKFHHNTRDLQGQKMDSHGSSAKQMEGLEGRKKRDVVRMVEKKVVEDEVVKKEVVKKEVVEKEVVEWEVVEKEVVQVEEKKVVEVEKVVEKEVVEEEVVGEDNAVIALRITCYHWSSLEAKKTWNVTLKEPSLPVKCIHMSRVSDMLMDCSCTNPSQCFFHFKTSVTRMDPPALTPVPLSHLFLTSLSAVVGLERANVQITDFHPFDSKYASIVLSTDRISPFTWLEAPGFSGRFSNNGFLMVDSEVLMSYTSWEPVEDWGKFRASLTVRTYLDAYKDE